MQNSGVDYGMGSEFEVVSILDGTVMEVIDDEIMGKTVKIKHSNEMISVYQSLGSVDVKVDDKLSQGMIIGKSGEANVSSDLGNHLHFELYHNGSVDAFGTENIDEEFKYNSRLDDSNGVSRSVYKGGCQ